MAFINARLTEEEQEEFKERNILFPPFNPFRKWQILGYSPLESLQPCTMDKENKMYLFDCGDIDREDYGRYKAATTYLYSGGISDIGNVTVKNRIDTIPNARIIDNTKAGYFLSSIEYKEILENAIKNEIWAGTFDINSVSAGFKQGTSDFADLANLLSKPALSESELDKAVRLASIAYNFELTKGAWANLSKSFDEKFENGIQRLILEINTYKDQKMQRQK
ncbi:hypothetical protein LQZ18_13215 [Lachnospiraceae bacterium ZAX-1]